MPTNKNTERKLLGIHYQRPKARESRFHTDRSFITMNAHDYENGVKEGRKFDTGSKSRLGSHREIGA